MSNFYVTYADYRRKPTEGYALRADDLDKARATGANRIEIRHLVNGLVWSITFKKLDKHLTEPVRGRVVVPFKCMHKEDAVDPRRWGNR